MTAGAAPRIAPVESPDPAVAALLAKTLIDSDGEPLNLFATLAHHPRLLRRFNALGGLFMAHATIPTRDREVVILRVAGRTRSRYELAQHARISASDGITATQVAAIAGGEGEADLDSDDLLLLRLVDELIERDAVGDATWRDLSKRYDEPQLLELVCLVGYYRMVAGYVRSVAIETEPELPIPEVATGPDWQ